MSSKPCIKWVAEVNGRTCGERCGLLATWLSAAGRRLECMLAASSRSWIRVQHHSSNKSGNRVSTSLGNSGLCWTVFAQNRDTAMPAEGNGDLQTLSHSVSLWQDPDDVPHCRILSPDKTEWRLISATLCGWRRCFVADQLWFVTRIREEEHPVDPPFYFFHTKRDGSIPTVTPLTGAPNARGMKNSQFATNIRLYLRTDARQSHSYYGRRIGNDTETFK